jgi:hypothetical protein
MHEQRSPVHVALTVLAAIAEGQVDDVLDLIDPRVVWRPVTRPALTLYQGHAGVAEFAADLRLAYGPYRFDIEGVCPGPAGPDGAVLVTVHGRVIRETSTGQQAERLVLSEFRIKDGLVKSIESRYEA